MTQKKKKKDLFFFFLSANLKYFFNAKYLVFKYLLYNTNNTNFY